MLKEAYIDKPYAEVVERVINSFSPRVASSAGGADRDDIESVAWLAYTRYMTKFAGQFEGSEQEARVYQTVRSAIVDEIRRGDRLPAYTRRQLRYLSRARERFVFEMERAPSVEELAALCPEFEIERIKELVRIEQATARGTPAPGLVAAVAVPGGEPDALTEDSEMGAMVRDALEHLEPKMGQILKEHYFGGVPLKDIADRLGITLPQLYRLRDKALSGLRRLPGISEFRL